MVLEHCTQASYDQTRKHNLCQKSVSTVRDTGVRHTMKLYKPNTPSNGARTWYTTNATLVHNYIQWMTFKSNDDRSMDYKITPMWCHYEYFLQKQTGQLWNYMDKTLLVKNDSNPETSQRKWHLSKETQQDEANKVLKNKIIEDVPANKQSIWYTEHFVLKPNGQI